MNKFLQFNGRNIYFKEINSEYYIAIKPICEALNLNYSHHLISMKNDVLYGQLYRKYDMVGADNRKREMVCLPEQFIYGWICSLNSQSKEFLEYKVMCHNILYNYFKGTIVGRKKLLQRKNDIEKEIEQTEKELINNPAYQKIKELKKEQTQILKNLKNNDKQALENSPQLNFF